MKRNSTVFAKFRKLSVDARQWRGRLELTLERLPELFAIVKKVDADGTPTVIRVGYKIRTESVSDKRMKKFIN